MSRTSGYHRQSLICLHRAKAAIGSRKDGIFNFTNKQEQGMENAIKRYFVTNTLTPDKKTNQRFATSPIQAAISESKLYESDDLVLEVREQNEATPKKYRVTCRTSYDVQEIVEDAVVATALV